MLFATRVYGRGVDIRVGRKIMVSLLAAGRPGDPANQAALRDDNSAQELWRLLRKQNVRSHSGDRERWPISHTPGRSRSR